MDYYEYGQRVRSARERMSTSRADIIRQFPDIFTQANLGKIEGSGRVPTREQEIALHYLLGIQSVRYEATRQRVLDTYDLRENVSMLVDDVSVDVADTTYTSGDNVRLIQSDFPLKELEPGSTGFIQGVYLGYWGVMLDIYWDNLGVAYPMFLGAGDVVEIISSD